MASLFKALKNLFRGWNDKAAEAVTDPIRDGKFAIEDAKKEKDKFEGQIATLMAQRRQFEREAMNANAEVTKWGDLAKKAAASGNQDDARVMLTKQIEAEKNVAVYTSEATKCKATETKLRAQLENVRQRIASAESNHALHAARLTGARMRKAVTGRDSNLGSALADLDALERQANAAEDEAAAFEELDGTNLESLETKYAGQSADVENRLAELLAK